MSLDSKSQTSLLLISLFLFLYFFCKSDTELKSVFVLVLQSQSHAPKPYIENKINRNFKPILEINSKKSFFFNMYLLSNNTNFTQYLTYACNTPYEAQATDSSFPFFCFLSLFQSLLRQLYFEDPSLCQYWCSPFRFSLWFLS